MWLYYGTCLQTALWVAQFIIDLQRELSDRIEVSIFNNVISSVL
jgi:hypothetical protein